MRHLFTRASLSLRRYWLGCLIVNVLILLAFAIDLPLMVSCHLAARETYPKGLDGSHKVFQDHHERLKRYSPSRLASFIRRCSIDVNAYVLLTALADHASNEPNAWREVFSAIYPRSVTVADQRQGAKDVDARQSLAVWETMLDRALDKSLQQNDWTVDERLRWLSRTPRMDTRWARAFLRPVFVPTAGNLTAVKRLGLENLGGPDRNAGLLLLAEFDPQNEAIPATLLQLFDEVANEATPVDPNDLKGNYGAIVEALRLASLNEAWVEQHVVKGSALCHCALMEAAIETIQSQALARTEFRTQQTKLAETLAIQVICAIRTPRLLALAKRTSGTGTTVDSIPFWEQRRETVAIQFLSRHKDGLEVLRQRYKGDRARNDAHPNLVLALPLVVTNANDKPFSCEQAQWIMSLARDDDPAIRKVAIGLFLRIRFLGRPESESPSFGSALKPTLRAAELLPVVREGLRRLSPPIEEFDCVALRCFAAADRIEPNDVEIASDLALRFFDGALLYNGESDHWNVMSKFVLSYPDHPKSKRIRAEIKKRNGIEPEFRPASAK